MVKFRVYYDGGHTFDGDPYEAPFFGVLAIVQEDKTHGRKLLVNSDYYVWQSNGWLGVDWIGMIDYLAQPGPKRVVAGRMVESEYFYSVATKANEDPDFQTRTGYYLGEKQTGE